MNNNKTRKEPVFFTILRSLLGLVFIFSSIVKGIDPLGTAYRVEDYLLAYHLEGLVSLSLPLAFTLIMTEFVLGFALIFKLRYKTIVKVTFFLMIFFTVVTWFDVQDNYVPDCGCFGDAIHLTNLQTFYKNLVLLTMAFILLFQNKTETKRFPKLIQYVLILIAGVGAISFQFYNYRHLPVIDFREWKKGKDMRFKNLDQEKIYVTYKNKNTGEIKEYLSPHFPWNDSVWRSQWVFVGKRIDDSQVIKPHHLIVEDENGQDITNELIGQNGYLLLIISYDLTKANGDAMIKISSLAQKLNADVNTALITASESDQINTLIKLLNINYPVYYSDETELKAMIRSNPGILLLHNGTIIQKWHYNDLPDPNALKKIINKQPSS